MDPQVEELLGQFPPSALIQKLGIEFEELSAERVVATMPVEGNTQPMGLLHGGATAALAESLASYGAMVHAHPDGIAVGVDLNITHHRPASEGLVRAVATAVHLGRTTTSHDVVVTNKDGKRVASARVTCAIRS